MTPLHEQLQLLEPLVNTLKKASSVEERGDILCALPQVEAFFDQPGPLRTFMAGLSPECFLAMQSVVAIGQGPIVFRIPSEMDSPFEALRILLQQLMETERFYFELGGIVGYHFLLLSCLLERGSSQTNTESYRLLEPPGFDLRDDTLHKRCAVIRGIEDMGKMAELYPVGGAGDRLGLQDEMSGEPLPAAKLEFCGRSLLAGLLRDLQAREYLYYKLHGQQILTPVGLMTSQEKRNDHFIRQLLEQNAWFGRPQESFFLFTQPLTPMVTQEGNWSLSAPLELCLKPGGHGAMWKVALDAGAFDWFAENKRRKVLVRQINNPLAGTDDGLLAFTGIGLEEDKIFGFASCSRQLNAAEGMDVLVERREASGYSYVLRNVEYTDFAKWGVRDEAKEEGSSFSRFPSNTNILFADLERLRPVVEKHPLPGLLINMKKATPFIDAQGQRSESLGGRLESTMQNIADYLDTKGSAPFSQEKRGALPTYLTYNTRRKTISVTKKNYQVGQPPWETPVGCFYRLLENSDELLREYCQMDIPPLVSLRQYLEKGPSYLFHYHPALGPLYSVIAAKLRKGRMAWGAELLLEIAEADICGLDLDGSLLVQASQPLGKLHGGLLHYGEGCGKCCLHNVVVRNAGINHVSSGEWWRCQPEREEALTIHIEGDGEFVAENLTFDGPQTIIVPAGQRVTARQEGACIELIRESIDGPSWYWDYSVDDETRVSLTRMLCKSSDPIAT